MFAKKNCYLFCISVTRIACSQAPMLCPFVFLFVHFSIRCCNQRRNEFFLPGKRWEVKLYQKNVSVFSTVGRERSVVHTKRSGVLLSAHLACALLSQFASKVCSLQAKCALKSAPDQFCNLHPSRPFPSPQAGRKTQHLRPTCALCFLHWNHTCRFCGAFHCQLSLD